MNNNDFNFSVPIEVIEKSVKKNGKETKEMFIQGIASTNDKDADEEVLEPSGYILDRFLSKGTINYEHLSKRSPKYIVGEPVEARIDGNKMFLKAKLWENSDLAKEIYGKMKEINENGSNRRAAFSIEGKCISRDPMNPKRITKALITNCAITFSPVNGNSFADIVKGIQKEDFIELEYDKVDNDKDSIYLFEKDGKKYKVGKDFKVYEIIDKSMDTTNTAPLVSESLDKKVKNVVEISKSIKTVSSYFNKNIFDNEFKEKIKKSIKNIF
jgi:hypothetical protein